MENITEEISIFDVANKFGIRLDGKGNLYHSPFRRDEHPSFSIFGKGKFFKDQATGETGNVITFTAKVKGVSTKEAFKLLLSEFGNGSLDAVSFVPNSRDRVEVKDAFNGEFPKGEVNFPELVWNDKWAEMLKAQRGIDVEALKYAFAHKCFGFSPSRIGDTWIVSDSTKLAAQARRVDGTNFTMSKSFPKALTLKKSNCSYPIGLAEFKNREVFCLCEGSTDFLACFHFTYKANLLDKVAPLAMLGSAQQIGVDFLKYFNGKKVIIMSDADAAGIKARENWSRELSGQTDTVYYYKHPKLNLKSGEPIGDLCDILKFCVENALPEEESILLNPFNDCKGIFDEA